MAMQPSENTSENATAMGRRTAKIAGSIFLTKTIIFVVTGLAFLAIVRILGPSTYGIYTLAIATAGFFGAFGDLGISTILVKFCSEYVQKKQKEKLLSAVTNGFAVIVLESALFTLLALLLAGTVAQNVYHNAGYTFALQLVSLEILVGTIWGSMYSLLIALGKGREMAISVVIQSLIQGGVGVVLSLIYHSATGPIIGLVASFAIGLVYPTYVMIKFVGITPAKIKMSLAEWKRILSFALPVGISNTISTFISNLSLVVLGFYSTALIIGNFGAAYKVMNTFDLFLGSIGFALLPLFSIVLTSRKVTKQLNDYYNYSIYFSMLFAAPVAFYIVMLATPFTNTLLGVAYGVAPLYLSIMAIGTLLMLVSTYTPNVLIGAGKVRKVLKYNIIIAILQVIMLPIIVSQLNGLGLVILIFVLVPIISDFLYLRRAASSFGIRLDIRMLGKVVLASAISALFIIPLILLIQNDNILLLIAAIVEQLAVYPIVAAYLGAVDKARLETLRKITAGLPVVSGFTDKLVDYASIFAS